MQQGQESVPIESAQLDTRWFARYQQSVSFDLFHWLAHAGSFNTEEQREWNQLVGREDQEAQRQRATIMAASRDRELDMALFEQREPRLYYPAIPIDVVHLRIGELQQLYHEIAIGEWNHHIRQFYLDAIDEQLDVLSMVEATYTGDRNAFTYHNYRIYLVPSPQEMHIALGSLIQHLRRGLRYRETAAISTSLLDYLEYRQLLTRSDVPPSDGEGEQESSPSSQEKSLPAEQTLIPVLAVKHFFETVLTEYQLDRWRVLIDAAALVTRVEPQIQAIILPPLPLPYAKVLHLLSHELESHTLRFVAGERSSLALLGIGTKGYLATEEGLALYADLMTARATNPDAPETLPWMGTLATGFACGACLPSGVVIPAHSFRALFLFLEQYNLLAGILNGTARTIAAMEEKARQLALTRCLRTFRGVPDLSSPGFCSVKDSCYLRGYLGMKEVISMQGEEVLTRLMVGAAAIEQLEDLAALGIVTPALRARWIARDPKLHERIVQLIHESGWQQVVTTPHA